MKEASVSEPDSEDHKDSRGVVTVSMGRAASKFNKGSSDFLDLDSLINETSTNIPKAARTSVPRHSSTQQKHRTKHVGKHLS